MPDRFANCKVDISTWPADERAHVVDLAHRYNTTVEGVDDNFRTIMGVTKEQFNESKTFFGLLHQGLALLHGHRLNALVLSGTLFFIVNLLKAFGVDTTSFAPFVEGFLKTVLGVG